MAILDREYRDARNWLYPSQREEYYKNLLNEATDTNLAIEDGGSAIDEYFERFCCYAESLGQIPGLGADLYWREVVNDMRQSWQSGGFSDPAIRDAVLTILQSTDLFTDNALKFFTYGVARRVDIHLPEIEVLGFHFATSIDPGIFNDQQSALRFLAFLADTSDEMYGKRPVDIFLERVKYKGLASYATVNDFVVSEEGRRCGMFGVVRWLTGDDSDTKQHLSPYFGLCKEIFSDIRNSDEYQKYSDDPQLYIATIFS